MCACAYASVCVCACAYACVRVLCTYASVCVCACVCVEYYEGGDDDGDEEVEDNGEETHCYCRKGDFGEMIACDNLECPV